MKVTLPTNWMTMLGGFLAGIPALITSSGLVLTPRWTQILGIIGGLGVLLVGLAAKDADTHSTNAQVNAASANVAAGKLAKV